MEDNPKKQDPPDSNRENQTSNGNSSNSSPEDQAGSEHQPSTSDAEGKSDVSLRNRFGNDQPPSVSFQLPGTFFEQDATNNETPAAENRSPSPDSPASSSQPIRNEQESSNHCTGNQSEHKFLSHSAEYLAAHGSVSSSPEQPATERRGVLDASEAERKLRSRSSTEPLYTTELPNEPSFGRQTQTDDHSFTKSAFEFNHPTKSAYDQHTRSDSQADSSKDQKQDKFPSQSTSEQQTESLFYPSSSGQRDLDDGRRSESSWKQTQTEFFPASSSSFSGQQEDGEYSPRSKSKDASSSMIDDDYEQSELEQLRLENKQLRELMEKSREQYEREAEEERKLFKKEINSLKDTYRTKGNRKRLEYKKEVEKDLEDVQQENERLRELLEKGQKSRRESSSSILSSVSAVLHNLLPNRRRSLSVEEQQVQKQVEENIGNLKLVVRQVEDSIKLSQRIFRRDLQQLKLYRDCFAWLRDERLLDDFDEANEDVAATDYVTAHKNKFSGLSPSKLVGRLPPTQLAVYISLLRAELGAQAENNTTLTEMLKEKPLYREGGYRDSVSSTPSGQQENPDLSDSDKQYTVESSQTDSEELAQVFEPADSKGTSQTSLGTHSVSLCGDEACKECIAALTTAATLKGRRLSQSLTNFADFSESADSKEPSSLAIAIMHHREHEEEGKDQSGMDHVNHLKHLNHGCKICLTWLQNLALIEHEKCVRLGDLGTSLEKIQGSYKEQEHFRQYTLEALHNMAQRCQKEFSHMTQGMTQALTIINNIDEQRQIFWNEIRQKMEDVMKQKNQMMQEVRTMKEESYGLLKRSLDRLQDFREEMKDLPSSTEDLKDLASRLHSELLLAKATSEEMSNLAQHQLREQLIRLEAYEKERTHIMALLKTYERSTSEKTGELLKAKAEIERERIEKIKLEEKLRRAWAELTRLRKCNGGRVNEEVWPVENLDESEFSALPNAEAEDDDAKMEPDSTNTDQDDGKKTAHCSNCKRALRRSSEIHVCRICRRVMCVHCLLHNEDDSDSTNSGVPYLCEDCLKRGQPSSPPKE